MEPLRLVWAWAEREVELVEVVLVVELVAWRLQEEVERAWRAETYVGRYLAVRERSTWAASCAGQDECHPEVERELAGQVLGLLAQALVPLEEEVLVEEPWAMS